MPCSLLVLLWLRLRLWLWLWVWPWLWLLAPALRTWRWEHRHQTKRRRKRPRWRLRRPPRAADLGRVGFDPDLHSSDSSSIAMARLTSTASASGWRAWNTPMKLESRDTSFAASIGACDVVPAWLLQPSALISPSSGVLLKGAPQECLGIGHSACVGKTVGVAVGLCVGANVNIWHVSIAAKV